MGIEIQFAGLHFQREIDRMEDIENWQKWEK